ncbi:MULTISPECIES: endonuclease/exonuclease/phosphatase family protein [Stenotrophomonas]|uniref:endonuclease/exonuclease/phosphatase family protein n=1 Tax=Stenotrophomonas TaxID=40323 RepID=UPI0021CAA2F1|nr:MULTISPECIES: endonuclease/exonuclease/phosphatase family protein [Stenotrophomonas]MCU0999860.1 endonuclease/exonuclease/phosphatase family protein [Stenotrophomonas maltophilia]MCU1066083.1 endonuclease/exonuclease/phosphatase family protein [Stenotrophomonas maltophilia]MCU1077714.1 endonuclease/exonuclease/phosphatase family protein [Stenotrophomonas maltophilia]MCU1139293.1 endonuclease/exonuclease/phosphatase family protein [Stenotrophomonas maltophilia]
MRPLAHARLLLSCFVLLLALQAQAPGAAASEGAPRQLTVAALELPSRDDTQWKQRREQVAQLLTDLQPDVISVQQVLQQQGRNPACWLASRLRYSCDFVTADPPSQPLRHGNAMLTRLPVSEDGVTLLHPPSTFSAAGMMRLKLGEALVNIYVARLRPDPDEATARQHQTSDLMTWIGATAEGMPSLIAGDFSANTVELVRSTPGFQPARRNPGGRAEAPAASGGGSSGHGLDVLFQVKHFGGIRQQPILLPADGDLPGLRLGVMATVRLQGDAPTAE